LEPSVQARWERTVFLVEVDEIGGSFRLERMPPLLEAASGPWLGILLAGKDENDIASFIAEWHPVGEGIPPHSPPHVHSQVLINASSRHIEGLVTKGLNHSEQLRFGPFARHSGGEAYDSRHGVFP
jgi:hypothetical protein